MQYGKIENYKIIGTCLMQTPDFPDEIPDEAVLFDFLIGEKLFKSADYQNKIISVVKGVVTWSDDTEKINAEADNRRLAAYTSESDALFFKEQRGEIPAGAWAAKVAEIKKRFPKV